MNPKNIPIYIGGLILGFLAMYGFMVMLEDYTIIAELQQRERIRRVILEMKGA